MERQHPFVDLRNLLPARVRGASFAEARQLRPGDTLTLLVAQEPTLLLHSVNLQLGNNLVWTIAIVEGGWRIDVRHRLEAPAQDLLDGLAREHRHLDRLMAGLLQAASHTEVAGLVREVATFAGLLRRHIAFENDHLAPLSAGGEPQAAAGPTAIMLREHEEILHQLAILEDSVKRDDREEIGALVAILSGTLAKHEHREEQGLFPCWRAALATVSPEELASLGARAAPPSPR